MAVMTLDLVQNNLLLFALSSANILQMLAGRTPAISTIR